MTHKATTLLRVMVMLWVTWMASASHDFTIVIDAGSTGCRLYVYQTDHAKGTVKGSKGLKVTPGLSSFATHPEDLKEYIKPLFIDAQAQVPREEWSNTDVHIKATAGMRLITQEQVRVIYDTLYSYLSSNPDVCPFAVNRANLQVISGNDEGYYGALSANFLAGVLDQNRLPVHHEEPVMGALDLGGSSTQISVPLQNTGGPDYDKNDFFVHSYLGYGVEKLEEKHRSAISRFNLGMDPCAPMGYTYALDGVSIKGTGNYGACMKHLSSVLEIQDCYAASRGLKVVPSTARCSIEDIQLPPVHPHAKFVGMSVYYFALRTLYVWADAMGTPRQLSWPKPSLDELAAVTEQYCGTQWSKMQSMIRTDSPWERFMGDAEQREAEFPKRCLQSAYIEMLLGHVYGIPRDAHNVEVALDINSMEVEWTLGSVLDQSGPATTTLVTPSGTSDSSKMVQITLSLSVVALAVAALVAFCSRALRRVWIKPLATH